MTDLQGQQFGNYRLTRLLGQGGFADVYQGEHIHLHTQAAIKILQTRLSNDDIERFRREARMIAGLEHPHIIRVLDFGIENNIPFLVMSYAPNGTLRHRHPEGTLLSLESVVMYVKQVADALQYAHDQRLIHRDVKPENMLVGQHGEVLLSDFGIAIVAQSSYHQRAQDTAGTIAYMAPEQIRAQPHPASDQYSLGIIAYEWLSGSPPFHGTLEEVSIKHRVVPPPPLHEKIPTISPEVEQIVMTVLAKDVKERFGSVRAFANALEQASQSMSNAQAHMLTAPPPSNQTPEPIAGRSLVEQAPLPANGELSSGQATSPTLPSPPRTSPYTSGGILRRTMLLGLGLAGLAVTGGGLAWTVSSRTRPSSPTASLTPSPSSTSAQAPSSSPTFSQTPSSPSTPTPRSNLVGYYSDASGKLTIGIFREVAAQPQEHFTDFPVEIDSDMVVIGGGGRGDDVHAGALLTASYPRKDMAAWLVSSKDHVYSDPHYLFGFAIGLKIAGMSRDELLSNHSVAVFSTNSETAQHPEATVNIPSEFVLLGGGFNVHWQGAGNLATASFPSPTNTWTSWTARSKDHEIVDPSILTTYAIGLRRILRVGTVMLQVATSQSGTATAHPTSTALLRQGLALTGGGAEVHWTGAGNLLWQLEPVTLQNQGNQQFIASSKDHGISDPSTITTYALGIQIV
jgi:serine/threonine protein kinase